MKQIFCQIFKGSNIDWLFPKRNEDFQEDFYYFRLLEKCGFYSDEGQERDLFLRSATTVQLGFTYFLRASLLRLPFLRSLITIGNIVGGHFHYVHLYIIFKVILHTFKATVIEIAVFTIALYNAKGREAFRIRFVCKLNVR